MKKGRHRRYEEARALKRGPDLDIDALFTDLGGADGPPPVDVADVTDDEDEDGNDESWEYPDDDEDDW